MAHDRHEYAQVKAQTIKEACRAFNRSGIVILDVGCGQGLLTYYLQELFFNTRVMGIDVDQELIVQAQELFPHITFKYTKQMQNEAMQADLVIISDVLHHVAPANRLSFLQHTMNYIKPNVQMVLTELNPNHPKTMELFREDPSEKNAYPIRMSELIELCQHAAYNGALIPLKNSFLTHNSSGFLSENPWYGILLKVEK